MIRSFICKPLQCIFKLSKIPYGFRRLGLTPRPVASIATAVTAAVFKLSTMAAITTPIAVISIAPQKMLAIFSLSVYSGLLNLLIRLLSASSCVLISFLINSISLLVSLTLSSASVELFASSSRVVSSTG